MVRDALLEVLFTFWPPAPADRAKVQESAGSGMQSPRGVRMLPSESMSHYVCWVLLQQIIHIGVRGTYDAHCTQRGFNNPYRN